MAGIGHIAFGMAAARFSNKAGPEPRAGNLAASMIGWSLLSMLPDADVIGFSLGVAYDAPWGHRGATHSFVFAAIVGAVVGLVARAFRQSPIRLGSLAMLVVASHGL